nr:uncharacterized protein LOC106678618 [Halyomorpha halys]
MPAQLLAPTLVLLVQLRPLVSADLNKNAHRTSGAYSFKSDLFCYYCDTSVDGPGCHNLSIHANRSSLVKKCGDEMKICIVKKFSYQTSTENSTSKPKLWALQRNCTSKCEQGCISVGERTKLFACTYCCHTNSCNSMMGKSPSARSFPMLTYFISLIIPVRYILYDYFYSI